jgi:hypothetical protein
VSLPRLLRKWTGRLLLCAVACVASPGPVWGQFNGNFAIERFVLDDENFLDWKAYQQPQIWKYDWYTARNGFRASVGSLSKTRFYSLHEIKLQADWGRYAAFLYTQEQESFFRSDEIYQEVEIRLGRGAYASLVGWPAPDKRFDNLGGALAWGSRTDWDYLRVSYINQFAQYNEKNREGAKEPGHYERTPVLERIEGRRFWRERLFVQLDLKREAPAEFHDEAARLTRRYEGREIDTVIDWWGAERDWLAGVAYSEDLERRAQRPADLTVGLPELSQTLELAWLDAYAWVRLSDLNAVAVGYLDSRFLNRIRSNEAEQRFQAKLTTGQAYILWERNPGAWLHWLFSLQAGRADSSTKTGAESAKKGDETGLQVKGGAGLVLAEAERYRFLFNSTWDLDLFAERAWDGGNVQIQIFF